MSHSLALIFHIIKNPYLIFNNNPIQILRSKLYQQNKHSKKKKIATVTDLNDRKLQNPSFFINIKQPIQNPKHKTPKS